MAPTNAQTALADQDQPQAQPQPLDLSAGLVPKQASQPLDLSAGLVPKQSDQTQAKPEPTMMDKAGDLANELVNELPGIGPVHQVAGVIKDWASKKLQSPDVATSPVKTAAIGAARDLAGMEQGATSPQGLAIAGGAVAAPAVVGPALVAHGLYSGITGWGDIVAPNAPGQDLPWYDRVNPDALQNVLNAGAEAVGGATLASEGVKGIRAGMKAKAAAAAPVEAMRDFQLAIPPSKAAPYNEADWHATRPYLEEQHGLDSLSTPKEVEQAANKSVDKLEARTNGMIDANPDHVIKVNPIDAVRQALSGSADITFLERGLKSLERFQLGFERKGGVVDPQLTLRTGDDLRWQLNREMDAVLKKNNYDRATARATDPGFAAAEAAAESLRNGVYDGLEELGFKDARQLRLDEGSLIKIRNAANRQEFRGDKQVAGSDKSGPVRKLAAKAIKLTTTAGGAAKAGPLGAAVGSELGDRAAGFLDVKPLTRNELITRSFEKTLHPPAGTPEAAAAVTSAPVAGAPTTTAPVPTEEAAAGPGDERFAKLNEGQEASKSPEWMKQQFDSEISRLDGITRDKTATLEEKAIAQNQLDNMRQLSDKMLNPKSDIEYRTDTNGTRWAKSLDSPAEVSIPKELKDAEADKYAKEKLDLQKQFAESRKAAAPKAEPKPEPKVEPKPAEKPKPEPKDIPVAAPTTKSKPDTAAVTGALAGTVNQPAEQTEPEPEPVVAEAKAESSPSDIPALIQKAAEDYNVPPPILHAQARQESGLNPDAVSPRGATGIMQLMPGTADALGVDANDPAQNVGGGARYLKQQYDRFGDYDKALAAYNWGPEHVQSVVKKYGNDWLSHTPQETQHYVKTIIKNSAQKPEEFPSVKPILDKYKGLAKNYKPEDVEVIQATPDRAKKAGDNILEFWPPEEKGDKDFPRPVGHDGKTVLEFYKKGFNPEDASNLIVGDLLHGMDSDPKWSSLKKEFVDNYTPAQQAFRPRLKKEGLSDKAIDDMFIRGGIVPGQGEEWKRSDRFSPKQKEVLAQMKKYLEDAE